MDWTPEQRRAVDARGTDLLVTAAAGSGKTAVLVERILSLLREGADISRMLVVTFTRAAAASMREKLSARLYEMAAEDAALLKQAERVEGAMICTIDSFCAEFLRSNCAAAGVDPSFRIIEEAERGRLAEAAAKKALAEAYAEGAPDFERFARWREGETILKDMLEIIKLWDSLPDADAWEASQPTDVYLHRLALAAGDDLAEAADMARGALAGCEGEAILYEKTIRADIDALEGLLRLEYQELRAALDGQVFGRLPSPRRGVSADDPQLAAVKEARERYKNLTRRAKELVAWDPEACKADTEENRAQLGALVRLARRAYALLAEALDEDNALGFPDMARRTLSALDDPDVASSARERYRDAVFVDEYQDVSALQDAVIEKVSQPGHLFLVGDVKQSIYRFRLAEPGLFLSRRERYGRGEGGERVALSANFRSRPPILSFTNLVFERAMARPRAEIPYDGEARLRPGREAAGDDPKVELYLLSSQAEEAGDDEAASAPEDMEEIEREATLAADRILVLMAENPELKFRDFAVLSRVVGDVLPRAADALIRRGIPAECETTSQFFGAMEIRVALALLRLTENRRRDTDWIAALRSGGAELTADELAQIRLVSAGGTYADAVFARAQADDDLGRRIRAAVERLEGWRALSRGVPAQELVFTILRESGLLEKAAWLPGGAGRVNRLMALCDRAAAFDRLRHTGLSGFLADLEEAQRSETDKMRSAPESEDAVRLMSIHASKGLEFPVVIGIRLGRRLHMTREASELRLHSKLGAGMRCVDPELGSSRDTLERRAVAAALGEEALEEELRLLYVMLTRARERLILIGSARDAGKALDRYRSQARLSPRPATLMDALVPPVLAGEPEYVQFTVDPPLEREAAPARPGAEVSPRDPGFRAAYSWHYPHEAAQFAPVKMTVTALGRELTGPAAPPAMLERPAFLAEAAPTGTEAGAAVHKAMSALKLMPLRGLRGAALRARIQEQLEHLFQRGILDVLPDAELAARFYESPLGVRALAAEVLYREWAFNLVTTPREAGHSDSGERLLVQGAVDLCFLEGEEWVLADYKTDRDDSELERRYAPQLRLYAKALTEITGRRVKEIWLCALRSARQYLLESV